MGSGLLQLVSYGIQDMYITYKPQITFFKVLYKRHTNFAFECIPQFFNTKVDFNNKYTCIISKNADLINKMYLVINLPPIGKFLDIPNETGLGNSKIACCSWTKNIGFQLISQIDIEIGGRCIDKHYSDWFNIWYEITTPKSKRDGLDKMIGNVKEMTEFTSSKQGYLLYIPLMFWFCRTPNLALPLVALYNTDIKINVLFASLESCIILGPSHYIIIKEDICLYEKGEILYQIINNVSYYYKFIIYDYITKKLYYIKITPEALNPNYKIYSQKNNNYTVTPDITNSAIEKLYYNKIKYFPYFLNLTLGDSYLLIDYIFLDLEERLKFAKNKHQYTIDTLTFDNDKKLYYANNKVKINYSLGCKEFILRCGYSYINNGYINDVFNYSTCIEKGNPIINNISILLNSQERFKQQSIEYFQYIQPYMYHTCDLPLGVDIYSFSINPQDIQLSGYCNLTEIDDIQINLSIDKNVSYTRFINFRLYAITINIIKIENGNFILIF
jgi:hypothetical protein